MSATNMLSPTPNLGTRVLFIDGYSFEIHLHIPTQEHIDPNTEEVAIQSHSLPHTLILTHAFALTHTLTLTHTPNFPPPPPPLSLTWVRAVRKTFELHEPGRVPAWRGRVRVEWVSEASGVGE